MLPNRPESFECPWCGPNGVVIDRTLPHYLQLCDDCLPRPTVDPTPELLAVPEAVTQLRAILRSHVRDFHQRWPGMEFGKAMVGNMLLGALERFGCDPQTELCQALADVTELTRDERYAAQKVA